MPNHRDQSQIHRVLYAIILVVIVAAGLWVRLYDLDDPPLDFHPTRQLHSILMARGMYYENHTEVPEWMRTMAVEQWKREGMIEPPIMERLAAMTYSMIGKELLQAPRLYSIFFWLLGAIPVFLLGKRVGGVMGSLVSLAYYWVLPYGAIASRAFQPDPLMTALIVYSWWALVRWREKPTWKRLISAGILGGAAILVKTTAVYFIGGAWAGLLLVEPGIRRSLRDPKIYLLGLLTILPYAIYHIYGVYIAGFLTSQFALRFFPQMWTDPVFYLRWNGAASSVVGFEWFVMALPATLLIKERSQRGLLIGIWAGYFLYGMTFPFHITTHDYYQLPFIPLVALGLAAGAGVIYTHLQGPKKLANIVILGVLIFVVVIKAWDVRVTLKRNDYRHEPAMWQQMGEKLGHSANFIALSHDYSTRLAYWGWTLPTNWMTSGDISYRELGGQTFDLNQMFLDETEGKDYFVVTLFSELESQPKIKSLLLSNFPLIAEEGDYWIFDLRHPLSKDDQPE